ncbi:MAG: DJ-1/PfpI family protein [Alphaproteobacteria bacterium]|nr:DJ-1/PfpI family protein [Alphaproteobacteria bacterium]
MRIAFVAYDGMTLLDLVGPYEVLTLWPDAEAFVVAERAGVVTPDSRTLPVVASHAFADAPDADLIVVPGGPTPEEARRHNALHAWLKAAAPSARGVFSVCTGAFHLGEAGLLGGRRATTHWAALADLARFGATPQEARWVEDGVVLTSAGVSAGIDAALHLTARLYGEDLARAIQLMIEYDPSPPFDAGSPATAGAETMQSFAALLGPAIARRQPQLRASV